MPLNSPLFELSLTLKVPTLLLFLTMNLSTMFVVVGSYFFYVVVNKARANKRESVACVV